MPLFNLKDLTENRERLGLQLELLPLSLVFNETEKQEVAIIYDELITIYDTALARLANDIEVKEYSYFLFSSPK